MANYEPVFEKLKNYCKTGRVFDLSFRDFDAHEVMDMGYPNAEAAKRIKFIAKHPSGSFIALVKADDKATFNLSLPIAWIDSEGEPNTVFADNIADALSVLYYGTGFVYDVLSNFDRGQKQGDLDQFLAEDFPKDIVKDSLKNYREEQADSKAFHLVENELGIKLSADPVELMKSSFLKNDWLNTWLYKE